MSTIRHTDTVGGERVGIVMAASIARGATPAASTLAGSVPPDIRMGHLTTARLYTCRHLARRCCHTCRCHICDAHCGRCAATSSASPRAARAPLALSSNYMLRSTCTRRRLRPVQSASARGRLPDGGRSRISRPLGAEEPLPAAAASSRAPGGRGARLPLRS